LHVYQNSQVGGIQQQILSLLRAYDRDAFDPAFCCLGPKGALGKEAEALGFEFHALGRQSYNRFSPGIVLDLYRLMKGKGVHVVRTHKYHANLYGRLAAWMAGVPVVISSVHGNYRKDRRPNRRLMNRLLLHRADRVVAVSDAIAGDIRKYDKVPPGKLLVFHNGVDTERFSPEIDGRGLRASLSIGESETVLTFIGRLVVNKGLSYLIEAMSMLRGELGGLRLLVVGDGSLRGEIEGQARSSGLGDMVAFLGERRDIPEVLAATDVFVMPSIAEGLPNALLEAMAMARPIVAAGVGGIPEVMKDRENGLLVGPKDARALASAIRSMVADREAAKRMGLAAREFIERNYSIRATARRWEGLYRSLLAEKSRLPL
jgi:glycosyltransferase involved in cell wall biosynthesis